MGASIPNPQQMSGLSEEDVQSQIDQMIKFIKQEAQEKADEIRVKADEDFTIMKQDEVEAEKKRIRQDYERKEKQVEVQKKIAYSTAVNANRLKILKARDTAVFDIKDKAMAQLAKNSSGQNYENMLRDLIVQAVETLGEKKCVVECRKQDDGAVKKAISGAQNKLKGKVGDVELKLSDSKLPKSCGGGVKVTGENGNRSCDNT